MNWKLAAGIGLAVVTSVGTTGANAADPIKIGAFLSVTGQMSPMGDPQKRTFDYMIDKINAQGGAHHRRI